MSFYGYFGVFFSMKKFALVMGLPFSSAGARIYQKCEKVATPPPRALAFLRPAGDPPRFHPWFDLGENDSNFVK